jgi:hypothetical protein
MLVYRKNVGQHWIIECSGTVENAKVGLEIMEISKRKGYHETRSELEELNLCKIALVPFRLSQA